MRFESAEFEASYGTLSQLPPSFSPEVAFSGRSNVGKSSLINKLVNRKSLARVSSVPGKTITVNFYRLENMKLIDLPGYGYAKISFSEKQRWSAMMEGFFSSSRKLKLIVQLVDMRHPPSNDDMKMIDFLEQSGYNYILAMTKSDKLNKTEYKNRLKGFETELSGISTAKRIAFSSVSGEGVNEIRQEIINAVNL